MTTTTRSTLARLRRLTPERDVQFHEALRIAELQATRLLEIIGDSSIEAHHITAMPRIRVVYDTLPVSGLSYWNGREWIISISKTDSLARQRFTLLHEFKHIIDHGATARLYAGNRLRTGEQQAEHAADYFAGCALVTKRALKSAWGNGLQKPEALAEHFSVSVEAIRVRLAQTGLDTAIDRAPTPRCARPTTTPRGAAQNFRPAPGRFARRRFA